MRQFVINGSIFVLLIILFSCAGFSGPIKDFKTDFGAKGDGKTDDSKAWNDAISYFNKTKKGKLEIPPGVYIIGAQQKTAKGYRPQYSNLLKGVNDLEIVGRQSGNGNRPVFKFKDGVHYGIFRGQTASLGVFLRLENCNNIRIRNLELDGNLPDLNLGAKSKTDLWHIGLYLMGSGIQVEQVHVHHFALDGFYVRPSGPKEFNILIENCISEYNGRQGLSMTGGNGLHLKKSIFRYTGKGGLQRSPTANVDLENHTSTVMKDILIENCQLLDNVGGSGSLNIAGKVDKLKVRNSKIGTQGFHSIQSNYSPSKNFIFENCEINGIIEMVVNSKRKDLNGRTVFSNCIISDNKNAREYGLGRSLINVFDDVEFNQCTFYVWNKRSLINSYKNNASDQRKDVVLFRGCTIKDIDSKRELTNLKSVIKSPERIKVQLQ